MRDNPLTDRCENGGYGEEEKKIIPVGTPATGMIRIVDDRGKVNSHTIADWWYPERTPQALG